MFVNGRLVYSWYRLLWVVVLFGLGLTACGADVEQTITFKHNEAWEAEMAIIFPPEAAALMGGLSAIETQLAEAVDELEAMGVTTSFEPGRDDQGNSNYTLQLAGQGLETLDQVAFDGGGLSATTVDGQRQIEVNYYPGVTEGNFTLTLIGGEIISSNGDEFGRGKVRWVNPPGRIEAVLTEKGSFNLAILLVPAGIILLAVVGGAAFRLSQGVRCANCGYRLSSQAVFCPNCGYPKD